MTVSRKGKGAYTHIPGTSHSLFDYWNYILVLWHYPHSQSLLCSLLFADQLFLHLVLFNAFFSLVKVTFLAEVQAWSEVCHLSDSSKSVLIGFLSRCSVGWGNIDQALFEHQVNQNLPCLHAHNHISNSATLSNSYGSLLSDLFACVQVEKMVLEMKL